nr:hypothetical protein [Micromonospora sp. DSM 115978]
MAQNEPYGDAEDPRFARYDRSGRHDDYRSSGAGSSGTRGRSPGRYDGHTPRTYRDSPARDDPGRGSRASYDGYESTGYDSRTPLRNGAGSDREPPYRGDPRRAAPPPRDARVTRDPRASAGEPRRPRDPSPRAPNR